MKRNYTFVVAGIALALLTMLLISAQKQNAESEPQTSVAETVPASYEIPVQPTGTDQFKEPLPGLTEVLSRIPDELQREQLEFSVESYREAVENFKTALNQLPDPIQASLLAGDDEAVAIAAAQDPSIVKKIKIVEEEFSALSKARDLVTVMIAAMGNPVLAADIYRVLEIIDSDLPDDQKFKQILLVVIRRLKLLMEAIAAAESGGVSGGAVAGVADDIRVVTKAAARLSTGGSNGGSSSLEAYLPDGNRISFKLPEKMNKRKIQELLNKGGNSVLVSVEADKQTLKVVHDEYGDVLFHITQSPDSSFPSLIIVD